MVRLKEKGYSGDVKIFKDLLEQGLKLSDQIVMHGVSEKDASLALKVAEEFFRNNLSQKNLGKDEVIDGKKYSYSRILAIKIFNAIKNK